MIGYLMTVMVVVTQAGELPSVMVQPEETGVVVEVPDAGTLKLADGRTVELMGVEGADAEAARQWLEIYTLDRRVELRYPVHVGWARVRAVPVLWGRTDVVGLMLLNGHGQLSLRGTEPAVVVTQWRRYQGKAVKLRLGLWARTDKGSPVVETVLPGRPVGVIVWPQRRQ